MSFIVYSCQRENAKKEEGDNHRWRHTVPIEREREERDREVMNEKIEKLIDNINKMNDDQFAWFIAQALPVIFCK